MHVLVPDVCYIMRRKTAGKLTLDLGNMVKDLARARGKQDVPDRALEDGGILGNDLTYSLRSVPEVPIEKRRVVPAHQSAPFATEQSGVGQALESEYMRSFPGLVQMPEADRADVVICDSRSVLREPIDPPTMSVHGHDSRFRLGNQV